MLITNVKEEKILFKIKKYIYSDRVSEFGDSATVS